MLLIYTEWHYCKRFIVDLTTKQVEMLQSNMLGVKKIYIDNLKKINCPPFY
jgi:hypothetical protein